MSNAAHDHWARLGFSFEELTVERCLIIPRTAPYRPEPPPIANPGSIHVFPCGEGEDGPFAISRELAQALRHWKISYIDAAVSRKHVTVGYESQISFVELPDFTYRRFDAAEMPLNAGTKLQFVLKRDPATGNPVALIPLD